MKMPKKFINNYQEFLFENKDSTVSSITIPKGEILFHGTMEKYDASKLRAGGYDKVLWTATDSVTAQSYIPTSGSKIHVSSEHLIKPSNDEATQNIQKAIGIDFDYSKIKFDNMGRATSYPPAPVFNDIREKYLDIQEKYREVKKEVKELSNIKGIFKDKELIQLLKQKVKEEQELEDLYFDKHNVEKNKLRYVNEQLRKMGYTPQHEDSGLRHSWKIKLDSNNILRADENVKGRLIILEVVEDLKIYDYTLGESIEGDLTDLDYHKIDLFRIVEKKGYDGIKINDFLQSDIEGNVNHISIGIFNSSISKVRVKDVIEATHPQDLMDRYRNHKGRSSEYEKYLKLK